ncbi:MAG: hypothetical protein M3N18_09150, partial [Actinomycetota bacterium]|nr:hypothetical protein [Actinomycetota bacterium]
GAAIPPLFREGLSHKSTELLRTPYRRSSENRPSTSSYKSPSFEPGEDWRWCYADGPLNSLVCATVAHLFHHAPGELYKLRHDAPGIVGRGPFYVVSPARLHGRGSAKLTPAGTVVRNPDAEE